MGQRIIDSQITFDMPGLYATILLAGALGYAPDRFSIGADRAPADLGIAVPTTGMGRRLIVRRELNSSKPADYLAGFSIKRR